MRVRWPGATSAQNTIRPAAPAVKTLYSSSWPCGAMYSQKWSALPYWVTIAFASPSSTALPSRKYSGNTPVMPKAMQAAASVALWVQTCPANAGSGWAE